MGMKLINWFSELLKDEKGNPSSKRLVGIICSLTLCVSLYHNNFYTSPNPSPDLINAVALLAFGCLGLSSIDKFTNRQIKKEEN